MLKKQLNPEQFCKIRRLLPDFYLNIAILEAVLEKKILGSVWLNQKEDACLITTNTFFNFISGNINHSFLLECLTHIDKNEQALIICCSDPEYFNKNFFPTRRRLHFSANMPQLIELKTKIQQRILNKYKLLTIDGQIFGKCNWKDKILEFYGTKENFLKFGYGTSLMLDDIAIAEVYGVIGGNYLEIGAYTNSKFRGRGLAALLVTIYLKHYCLEKKLNMTASCNDDNIASKKSLLHFGFTMNSSYLGLEVLKFMHLSTTNCLKM